MYKYIFWIFLLIPGVVFSQKEDGDPTEKEKRTFVASVWLGVNAAQIDGDDLAGYDKLGLAGGAKVFIVLHQKWRPSIEIAYAQKGSRSELFSSGNGLETIFTLDYVQIPIMMNYVDRRIHFSAGLGYGQLVRANVVREGIDDPDFVDFYRRYDLSFIGGASFFVTKHIGLNIRWEKSLINIINDPAKQGQLNKLITFRVGYMF